MFDPFFTTKAVGQGTGMGMPISYQIVIEKHGGKLDCASTPGEGTDFITQIPIRQADGVVSCSDGACASLEDCHFVGWVLS